MAHKSRLLEEAQMAGLPMLVVSPVDVGRLLRELEQLDGHLSQEELRNGPSTKLPRTSQLMDQLMQLNKLNLLQKADRQKLATFLDSIKRKAPVLHMSFSTDPSTAFMEKLVAWLRREVDPLVLVTIGLQPNIGAGCVIRSANKYFDLSLRKDFDKKRDLLREALGPITVPAKAPVMPAAPVAATVAAVAPTTPPAAPPVTAAAPAVPAEVVAA